MSNKMWGGRFGEGPDAIMEEINVSIDVDRHLYAQDIAASKAHAAMLSAQGIITANDAKNIARGLDTILSEIGKGSFDFKRALEDIHMNVEARLKEIIGAPAGRLHTARSRNDQIALDFRLWVRRAVDGLEGPLFVDLADSKQDVRSLLDARGFTEVRPFTRMLYGSSTRFDDAARTFAVIGPEFG